MGDTFDYIIVGSGTGGSVLASRLTEEPGTTVLVLEAGGSDLNPYIHVPAGFMRTMVDGAVNWLYETELLAGGAINTPQLLELSTRTRTLTGGRAPDS